MKELYNGCYAFDPFGILCKLINIQKDFIDYIELLGNKVRRISKEKGSTVCSFFKKVSFVDFVGDDIYYPLGKIIVHENSMSKSLICGVDVDKTGLVTYFVNGEWVESKALRNDNWLIDNHPFGYPVEESENCFKSNYD